MATDIVIYHDSVSHRMLRLLGDHPTQSFTRGQLLAAADTPVRDDGEPTVVPSVTEATTKHSRSATVQIAKLLSWGLMVRTEAEGPRSRLDGSAITQQFYTFGKIPEGHHLTIRSASAKRPGGRIDAPTQA